MCVTVSSCNLWKESNDELDFPKRTKFFIKEKNIIKNFIL